ncbi:hypothetical protein [Shewanella sp. SNU WT4]|uniref:hypothetical protein n=1 Tax=Shewanella sp. SNU WT4 TaxID=2590015 RepID=UPI00143CDADA|nr:hypothetical protein [Shewanella sp. SNU WT4]
MIAIVLLQFVATNSGAHQLHLDVGVADDENSHPHLQFVAPVLVTELCVQCQCNPEDGAPRVASELTFLSHEHQSVEWQSFDLCLDCQCHGGAVSLLSFLPQLAPSPIEALLPAANLGAVLVASTTLYRPPIV